MASKMLNRMSRRACLLAGCMAGLSGWKLTDAERLEAQDAPPAAKPPRDAKPGDALPRWPEKDLSNWRVVDKFVFKRHGKVEWKDGSVALGKGDPGTAIVWSGAAPPTNHYELSLEARRDEGDDFMCGLTFPVDKSHCTLIVGGWGGSVTGLSNVDDFPAVENETTNAVEIVTGRWHAIRLRVTPTEILAWFDKTKIVDLDAKDKRFSVWWEQEPVRPLGIATWNTAASIRRFQFRLLKS